MHDTRTADAVMARAAKEIEIKHQQIHALQTRLEGQMTTLSQRWHGRTSAEFQAAYSKFDTEFERVKQELDTIHSSLVETTRSRTGNRRLRGVPTHRHPLRGGAH